MARHPTVSILQPPQLRHSREGGDPWTLTFTSLQAADGIRTPEGRPPWMAAVFGPSQDGSSENADATSGVVGDFDFTRKVLSLVTFFAPAKKVTRLQAKAFDFCSVKKRTRSNPFALTREFISFAGPKETNQRKGPSPRKLNSEHVAGRDFRTRHSMARSKNGAHPCAPPSGSADKTGYSIDVKVKVQESSA